MSLDFSKFYKHFFCELFLQTECIDLSAKRTENVPEIFAKSPLSRDTGDVIDSDGLPRVGEVMIYLYKLSLSLFKRKKCSSFFLWYRPYSEMYFL